MASDTAYRVRQVFTDGGGLTLVPDPAQPRADATGPATGARLALALLLVRHALPADGRSFRYDAVGSDGRPIADERDGEVAALVEALRGTDLGAKAQRAALADLAAGQRR